MKATTGRGPRTVAALAAASLVVAGCSSSHGPGEAGPSAPSETTGAPQPAPPPVRWTACGNGFQCGTVTVPLDYSKSNGPLLRLAVTRRPAMPSKRKGVLVVDFGGPGISGAETLQVAAAVLPKPLLTQLDVVSFDPRGSGKSGRLRCDSASDAGGLLGSVTGAAPTAAAGAPLPASAAFRRVHTSCQQSDGPIVNELGSSAQARDLDRLRMALGEKSIRYLGLSYGSVLGLAYASAFGDRIDAMLLDSPIDPTQPFDELAGQQAEAAENALTRAFSHDLAAPVKNQFDALATRLRQRPLPAPGGGDNTPVSLGDLQLATLTYLQMPTLTPGYPAALKAAAGGDGKALRQLATSQYQDVGGNSVLGTYWATLCADSAERPSPVAANTAARALAAHYPRTGAVAYAFAGGGCTAWPKTDGAVALPTNRLPIAVIGSTGDPIAPYASAQRLVRELPGARLITRVGAGHTAFANAAGDTCIADAESGFLLDPGSVRAPVRCTEPRN